MFIIFPFFIFKLTVKFRHCTLRRVGMRGEEEKAGREGLGCYCSTMRCSTEELKEGKRTKEEKRTIFLILQFHDFRGPNLHNRYEWKETGGDCYCILEKIRKTSVAVLCVCCYSYDSHSTAVNFSSHNRVICFILFLLVTQ